MLDLLLGFFALILGIYYGIYKFLKKSSNFLRKPFTLVAEKVRDFFEYKVPMPKRLDAAFSAFSGFKPFLLLCGIAAFACYSIHRQLAAGVKPLDFMDTLIRSTTLGSFFTMTQNGFETSPTTVVAVAFGGFVFSACYNSLKYARLYVKIPCFILYFLMSANLAILLSDVFATAGNWLYVTGMDLIDQVEGASLEALGKLLAAIPLVYLLLLLALITLVEYVECISIGMVGMLVLFLFGLLMDWILGKAGASQEAYQLTQQISLWLAVFGMAALRRPLTNWIEDFVD